MIEKTKTVFALLFVGAFLGFCVGAVVGVHARPKPDFTALLRSVGEIEQKCEALAASRCMNITTPSVNVSIYDTPNLGKR